MRQTGGARHIDAAMDRMDPGRARIRHDDPGGAEDRQAADNAEPSVERLGRERLAAGNGDLDLGVPCSAGRAGDFGDGIAHHLPRHRIDGGFAGRNGKARPGDRADALAGAKRHAGAGRAEPHRGDDQRAVRDVRIVAGVFDHAGGRAPLIHACQRQRKAGPLAARQGHVDRIGKFAGDQRRERRLRRRRGAGAGGPSAAQWPFLPLHGSSFSPFAPGPK